MFDGASGNHSGQDQQSRVIWLEDNLQKTLICMQVFGLVKGSVEGNVQRAPVGLLS